ncbi:glycosyltransferase [Aerococcus urinaeequi]|uniref:Glycosyltransferase n=1 Tax=Aerococcus urinaeequi TaxID=51665 RepID=A0AAE9XKU2_9LACT|nr:glycosyltransferase [Aerococcus urinaeequi]WCG37236.1 glycosyltransferase [Aerococcus urinaeequi]
MNILHIAPINFSKHSGLSTVIPNIIENQNITEGINSSLLLSRPVSEELINESKEKYKFKIYDYTNLKKIDKSSNSIHWNEIDLAVIHSTYIPMHLKAVKYLTKADIPYILVPHGAMTYGMLSHKKWKKKIGNILFFNKVVRKASAIQFLSKEEKERTKEYSKYTFIVENGMDISSFTKENFNSTGLKFTSISRLEWNVKGLDRQLELVNSNQSIMRTNKCKMLICGPDENNTVSKMKQFIKEKNLEDIVTISGPIYDDKKKDILLDTDVFVLLSRAEGQPMGVLEALSMGIPCLVSPGSNLAEDTQKYNFGWETDDSIEDMSDKLLEIIDQPEQLKVKSKNARNFINTEHSWEKITKDSLNYYKIILDKYIGG